MYGDNPYGDNYWENCTTLRSAEQRLKRIERICDENSLFHLVEKMKDRSARILEVGSGDGTFLHVLQKNGFENIRGIDHFPRHNIKYPELDLLIDCDTIQWPRHTKGKNPSFDIVCSHLVFDEDVYREQKNEGFRKAMLTNIHGMISREGLYYASERHDTKKILQVINGLIPRGNTSLGEYTGTFIPAK